jgi:MFS family permease
MAALVQGYLFGRIVKRVGDRRLVIAGALGMAIAIAAVPWLRTTGALYAWTAILAFSNSVASPAATGLVSRLSAPHEQGTMLGTAQAVGALGRLTGPVLVGQVYDVAGARPAFFTAAAIIGLGWIVSLRVPKILEATRPHPLPSSPPAGQPEIDS